jgi:HD-like signal output (HDOD) protein
MKFLAQKMRLEPYAAHAAGLFEECGKAVLFRHAPDHYRSMLRAAPEDTDLAILERAGFGIGHDELGARLCEAWMLSPEAVSSVRHHLEVRRTGQLPAPPAPASAHGSTAGRPARGGRSWNGCSASDPFRA